MSDVLRRDQTIDRLITAKLESENVIERENHVSSGKLSASMLWWPVQWQVLKTIGYPPKEDEEYVLRKFLRGRQVEDWFIDQMPGVLERQKEVVYKDTVGKVDALVDSAEYEFPLGIIPHEVKSVSNAKYKNIMRELKPDMGHALQACLYALALKADQFSVDYVATDDYRVECFILDTSKFSAHVEQSIEKYNAAMQDWKDRQFIPEFQPNEPWQANPQYNRYPDLIHISNEKHDFILRLVESLGEVSK